MPGGQHDATMGWWRFAAMIGVSTAIMFGLMYQLVYQPDHVLFSLNRFLASLVMACVMAIVMLGFMGPMYAGHRAKWAVVASAAVLGAALLWTNRQQRLVEDAAFLRAMIPHHSIAINNARKAGLSDPRVRALADRIILAQVREIAEMQLLLDDLALRDRQGTAPLPPVSAEPTAAILTEARKAIGR
jgi:hypothetical protein